MTNVSEGTANRTAVPVTRSAPAQLVGDERDARSNSSARSRLVRGARRRRSVALPRRSVVAPARAHPTGGLRERAGAHAFVRDTLSGASRRAARAAALLAVFGSGACTSGAYTLTSENDLYGFGNRDRYYTSGLRLSGVHDADCAAEEVRPLVDAVGAFSASPTTQVGWVLGQEIYTPGNTRRDPPNPEDRPYAGWLYGGLHLAKARRGDDPAGDRVDVVELDVGVVGPPSLAAQTQVSIHHLIDSPRPEGWEYQLHTEPGFLVAYEHRRRLLAGEGSLGAWDVIGVANGTVGNVSTHASVAASARWGSSLPRDFGVNTMRSSAVHVPDADGTDAHPALRWHVFAGVEARAVAHTIFLDGNTFRDSPSVDRETFVGELRAGLAIELGGFELGYTHVIRTDEFDAQPSEQEFGSITLTWSADF